jgi:RNA polymerase sigma-70 factor (ECF subfamily)
MTSALLELAFGALFSPNSQERSHTGRQATRGDVEQVLPAAVHEPSDDTLVTQIQSGDRDAFDLLVRRYHSRLVGAAEVLLGGRSEAEDIVQDVLLGVWVRRHEWNPAQGAAVYLFGSVTNRVRNAWRNRTRAQHSLEQIRHEVESSYTIADDVAEVWDAVGKLPERWRTALILRYVRDTSFANVGAAMQISENAAKKLVQRAIAFLSETLEKP